MTSIIVITNEKGGVGKTTTAGNLGAALAKIGKRVLLVDMDPQRNLTDLMGISQEEAKRYSIAKAIIEKKEIDSFIIPTNTEGVDIIPSTTTLRRVEQQFGASFEQDKLLRAPFESATLDNYDVVIIDTHGSQNCLLTSSLAIAHHYLIPLFPESDGARGVFDVIEYAERVRSATNRTLTLLGLVITGFHKGIASHRRIAQALRDYAEEWKVRVFSTMIPFSPRVKTAAENSVLLSSLSEDAPVTMAYKAVAEEMLPLLVGRRLGQPALPNLDKIAKGVEVFETMDVVFE